MRENEKETARTRVKRRGAWQVSQDTSRGDETVSHYTMLAIVAAVFFAGLWALACLTNAFFQDGPLSILKQLTTAISGH